MDQDLAKGTEAHLETSITIAHRDLWVELHIKAPRLLTTCLEEATRRNPHSCQTKVEWARLVAIIAQVNTLPRGQEYESRRRSKLKEILTSVNSKHCRIHVDEDLNETNTVIHDLHWATQAPSEMASNHCSATSLHSKIYGPGLLSRLG